ncbi:hypothetical protein [Streptomyces sp. ATCC 21386]|uniref:hypothetical protein n=1 Tax=Streptomyces sp. ATCC 21386 TaxID=2699428 RepID=UPI002044DC86|nr:hypothetical protein [Streptomyces sp. ATCC 21386]
MSTQTPLALRQSGQDWLLSCTDRPTDVRRAWQNEQLAPFSTGRCWNVVEAPLLRSMKALRLIGTERLGPVLADVESGVAWWLVPSGAGRELDGVGQA